MKRPSRSREQLSSQCARVYVGRYSAPKCRYFCCCYAQIKLRNIKPLFQFRTLSSTNIEFPEKRPQLFTEHTRYEPGDVLRANCSTPPSRPRAELRFTINQVPVSTICYICSICKPYCPTTANPSIV